MKKLSLAVLILVGGSVALCSLPLTSVAVLTVTLSDQNGDKITTDATATYLDAQDAPIIVITLATRGSWDNNLHWWSHSSHSTSKLRPDDAMRATTVQIEAKACDKAVFDVELDRSYEPLSFAPHGGGGAYFIYRFDREVVLQCN